MAARKPMSVNTATTEIEKESLEAHVELCAQRYDAMKDNMERMETRLSNVETLVKEIKEMLAKKENEAYKKLLSFGLTIITFLSSTLIGLVIYIIKNNLQ